MNIAPHWEETIHIAAHLHYIALYVRHHHERWDGTGYPCGLRKKEIPFGARIIAVGDTFDAMASSRPYRKGKNYRCAFEEIKKISGTQLCPEAREVFLGLRDEIESILKNVNKEIETKNLI